MSKAVMISIQPQHIQKMFPVIDVEIGKLVNNKTIEVRKTAPTIPTPFKCYIYMTATKGRCRFWEYITAYENSKGEMLDGSQKVIGEFVCDRIDKYKYTYTDGLDIDDDELLETMLDREEINIYANGKDLYGLHISNLVIYDKPKDLGEFYTVKTFRGYRKKDMPKITGLNKESIEALNHSKRVIVSKVTRPPQSWCYVEEV